ncbi:hypothetical protein Q4490_11525 [Neptunomonas phycophila]|uniref:Superinfection exclusion protein B n=1 Tax=Neptunomonas phycophila TaxID=1572645 RepID=A0AAW7XIY9_9GAMM|nr:MULTISPECIES: hypothetical protein [Neptunomonas]MDN2658365.1 hypothetical protein [Neptunomonas sp. CHC150]MDO6454191.1 hypothetical protein [Neptunomonas phycophila]
MKIGDIKTVYELMKDSTHMQIIWIGFLAAPFVVSAWFDLFDRIPFLGEHKLFTFIAVLIAFLLMQVVALVFDARDKKKKLLLAKIVGYMASNDYQIVRFSTLNDKLNLGVKEKELVALINTFPDKIRLAQARKKDENGNYITGPDGVEEMENAVGTLA